MSSATPELKPRASAGAPKTGAGNRGGLPSRDEVILVVEDNLVSRNFLAAILDGLAFTKIYYAMDGEEAVKMVADLIPDLVILDLNLPKMNGIDVCNAVRRMPEMSHTPVIIQSGRHAATERIKAFKAGATDYLIKPFDADELAARISVHLDTQHLMRTLRQYREQIQSELHSARQMQRLILPADEQLEHCLAQYGVKISGLHNPCDLLGGDLWGVTPVDESCVAVYIVDFVGHGVAAALNTFRFQSYLQHKTQRLRDPIAFLNDANTYLHDNLPRGQFATMAIAVVDRAAGEVRWARAGHPTPVVLSEPDVEDYAHDSGSGPALGATPNPKFEMVRTPLSSASGMFLYSDALIETPSMEAPEMELSQLPDVANAVYHRVGKDAFLNHFSALFNAIPKTRYTDDLTLVTLFWDVERDEP